MKTKPTPVMKTKPTPTPVSEGLIRAVIAHNKRQEIARVLFAAIEAPGDDVSGVIKAVERGADLNEKYEGRWPLEFALLKGKVERFKTLSVIQPKVGEVANLSIFFPVGTSQTEMTYLHFAAKLGLSLIVKFLVNKGTDLTVQDKHRRGFLAIHYAALNGDIPTMDALNVNNQAISARSAAGDFPLHIAAEAGRIDMAQHLVDLGADPNCRDFDERIPFHRAAQRAQKAMVAFLWKLNTSRNYWDKRGRNSYLYAVESDDTELVGSLVTFLDKFTYVDLDGIGAMHIAAEKNRATMMRYLKGKEGMTFLIKDKRGRMPIHFAANYNALDVFDLLIADLRLTLRASLSKSCQPNQLEQAVAVELKKTLLSWEDEAGDTVIEYAVRGKAHKILERISDLEVSLDRINKLGSTPMHEAAKVGDVWAMQFLNSNGVKYAQPNNAGLRPVHFAAQHGQIKALEEFKPVANNDYKCKDNDGMQPIHWASFAGQLKTVEWFEVNNGGTRNDIDYEGRNCLFHAVGGEQVELIDDFVNVKKMSLTTVCANNQTLLQYAVAMSAKKAIVALQKLGLILEKGMLLIHVAAEINAVNMFDCFVAELREELRASLRKSRVPHQLEQAVAFELNKVLLSIEDEGGDTVVEYAIRGKAMAVINRLGELGVSFNRVNKSGSSPMHEAAKTGDVSILALLIDKGLRCALQNNVGLRPVHVAAEWGRIDFLAALKRVSGIDFKAKDKDGVQPIHYASGAGQKDTVLWLEKNDGGTLNDVDIYERNCLFHAVRGDCEELTQYLVKVRKMSLSSPCSKKLTVMHHAVHKRAKRVILLLVKLGVSLEIPGEGGILPFHIAVRSGLVDMVDFLAEQRVNVNACNKLGHNAWFYAALTQPIEMLECLDKHHVKLPRAQDKRVTTPMHYAARGGNLAAIKFFERKGLSCFAIDKVNETPLKKARKQREEDEKEIVLIKQSPTYKSGENKEEAEKCRVAELRVAGCKEVEIYLMDLEQAATKADAVRPVAPVSGSAMFKSGLNKSEKRELEEPRNEADNLRVVKPKLWVPPQKAHDEAVDQEEVEDQVANSDDGDEAKESDGKRLKL